jgi:hypothetical protein
MAHKLLDFCQILWHSDFTSKISFDRPTSPFQRAALAVSNPEDVP